MVDAGCIGRAARLDVSKKSRFVTPKGRRTRTGGHNYRDLRAQHAVTPTVRMCEHPEVSEAKAVLQRYLQVGREALLWKLDGLSEYDIRRPLVPTGTNLLGLVKHVASVEFGYFGDVFGRPHGEAFPWDAADAEPNADMWATPEESRDEIVVLYKRAWAHSDATIEALSLDDEGSVPWWPEERRRVTLHLVLVHVIAETHRHAGHADIVRELIDGSAGWRLNNTNLPDVDETWWTEYRERLELAAREFADN